MDSSTPAPRHVVSQLPPYRPGKTAIDDVYKLASNELSMGPLPSVRERIWLASEHINRYPDAGCTRLYEAISEHLNVPVNHCVAGAGSVGVLFTLLSAWCTDGDEVVFAWRSFEAYPIAVQMSGAQPRMVPLRVDGSHDLGAMADAVTARTKVVLLCTPNNPTGPAISHNELTEFMTRIPAHVVVVIDEAYGEFVTDAQAARGLALLAEWPNIVVLRTFSKAYGLAGLRVGYAVADVPIAEAIAKATPPFSVSTVAQEAAIACLEAPDELNQRVSAVIAERARVVTELATLGWQVPAAQGNFCWLPTSRWASHGTATSTDAAGEAARIAEKLHPVTVRVFDGEGIRVSIGSRHANDVFLQRITSLTR